MDKIIDFTGNEQSLNGCLGCECLTAGVNPVGGILYKSKYFYVVQDFELPIDGFMIISPNRHVEKVTKLTAEEQFDLINIASKLISILETNHIAEEYNLILEEKKGVHLHLWLMPRHQWMLEKFGKVIKNIKPIQDYASEYMRTKENINKILQTCDLVKREMNK